MEDYALGPNNRRSFCWWLEYGPARELGSIRGGSAKKHIIYYSPKQQRWIYLKQFSSVEEAWEKLRNDLVELVSAYDQYPFAEISEDNLLLRGNMVRGKVLFLYHPDKFLPFYNLDHLQTMLKRLDVPEEEYKGKDAVECNLLLNQKLKELGLFENWPVYKIKDFLLELYRQNHQTGLRYYKVATGDHGEFWEECRRGGFISIGWDDLGDLTQYADYEEFREAFKVKGYPKEPISKNTEKANEVWMFFNLKPGDIVVANQGTSRILGIGTVTDRGYEYREDLPRHKHVVYVDWNKAFAGPITIPKQIRWAFKTVMELSESEVQKWLHMDKQASFTTYTSEEEKLFTKIETALQRKGQCILYGPPGTGKTYTARRYIQWKNEKKNLEHDQNAHDRKIWSNVELVTFHPSFSYEDFIEGFKPTQNEQGLVQFQLEKGIFAKLCARACENPDQDFYLIIDELNRGNVPKIFGEIITLLEKDKRGVEVILPQSKERFSIPDNVYIIATMNTSDRSIKMLDAAIRRRFSFIEMVPNYDVLDEEVELLGLSPAVVLKQLNERLIELHGRDKQIGHAYFMKEEKPVTSLAEFKQIYEMDIIPLIQEYCFDDYEQLQEIIGSGFVDVEKQEIRKEIFEGPDDVFISEMLKQFGKGNVQP